MWGQMRTSAGRFWHVTAPFDILLALYSNIRKAGSCLKKDRNDLKYFFDRLEIIWFNNQDFMIKISINVIQ